MARRPLSYWSLQIPGWLLFAYLAYAQGITAFDYELGVRMGTQEPVERISEVGAAFWYGFAFADLMIYVPLLAIGLIGHALARPWSQVVLGAALGVTVYWPIVTLAAAVDARDASGWEIDETSYWVVLPLISAWALFSLIAIARLSNAR